ncbi:MAG TPA: glycosyltransferase family 39 protein [Chitinophagales bacterium]|nr:glycosyltransferase family 39 protein [Chitinophagales bacterium]
MIVSKKYLLLASSILALYALGLNEYNSYLIRRNNTENNTKNARSLLYNSSVYSIDNVWYVSQIKNYLNGNGFTVNPEKSNYSVRRTPVYPLFYGLHYILFGEAGSYYYIRFTQLLIYILATIALFYAVYNFTEDKKIALGCALLYGFNPSLVSFLYYTITEALSPSLVCFIIYFLSLCKKYNRKKDWIYAGLFFAIGALCRPSIFFLSIGILFFIFYVNKKSVSNIFKSVLFFTLGASLVFAPHVVRNYHNTKEFILLEKYYGDPMDYGMPNIELRKWISCWMNPADYTSETISNNIRNAICCDTSKTKEMIVESEIQKLPAHGFIVNSKSSIKDAYSSLYDYYNIKMHSKRSPEIDSFEKISRLKFTALRSEFIRKAPIQYYIVTPLLFLKSVVIQSNSSQLVFLDNYKDSYVKIGFKILLLLLNIYLFISLAGCLIFFRKHTAIYGLTILFVLVNFLYIIFILKYFEARYLIPLFPCLYVIGIIFFIEIIGRLKKKLHV